MLTNCNVCGSPTTDVHKEIMYADGSVEVIFERRCVLDKNLVYGSIKKQTRR